MFFDLDGPYVVVQVYSDLVAPYESDHYQQHEFFDSFQICKMCLFDVESAGFHFLKAHLYLPPLGIIVLGLLRSIERDDDQEVPLLEFAARDITILAIYKFGLIYQD